MHTTLTTVKTATIRISGLFDRTYEAAEQNSFDLKTCGGCQGPLALRSLAVTACVKRTIQTGSFWHPSTEVTDRISLGNVCSEDCLTTVSEAHAQDAYAAIIAKEKGLYEKWSQKNPEVVDNRDVDTFVHFLLETDPEKLHELRQAGRGLDRQRRADLRARKTLKPA